MAYNRRPLCWTLSDACLTLGRALVYPSHLHSLYKKYDVLYVFYMCASHTYSTRSHQLRVCEYNSRPILLVYILLNFVRYTYICVSFAPHIPVDVSRT